MNRLVLLILFLFVLALGLANYLKPNVYLHKEKASIKLEEFIPEEIKGWTSVKNKYAPIRAADEEAKLNVIYSDTLERTYIDGAGNQVMLSIAYGPDQSNDNTQVHRPEYCYPAQGFSTEHLRDEVISLSNVKVPVRRLKAVKGYRHEFITYWIVLGSKAILPGFDRKLLQIEYGIKGYIPDGLLFRVSVMNASEHKAFLLQESFLRSLWRSLDAKARLRLFGVLNEQ
ncbi:MAG: EpsI family protein [Pseudomonadota bacterium]|nr:EpsI family protein [Pseudomonadota bacterium]